MDIMTLLAGDALNEVRHEFERLQRSSSRASLSYSCCKNGAGDTHNPGHRGLDLPQFVQVLLQNLPNHCLNQNGGVNGIGTGAPGTETREELVSHLCDLFDRIDVNGDGRLEWAEFTSFCVEACMVATSTTAHPLRCKFEDACLADHSSKGMISMTQWVPALQRALVCEAEGSTLKIYDCNGRLACLLMPSTQLAIRTAEAPRDVPSKAKLAFEAKEAAAAERLCIDAAEHSPECAWSAPAVVTAATYLHNATPPQIACASSDGSVSFWATDAKRLTPDIYEPFGSLDTGCMQAILLWCAETHTLYTAPASTSKGMITAWRGGPGADELGSSVGLERVKKHSGVLAEWVVSATLTGHNDVVTSLLVVSSHDLLVSAAMDNRVLLWDLVSNRSRGRLEGHAKAVRQLAYSRQHDMLLSAGFEFECIVWDIASRHQVTRLRGHRLPLLGVSVVSLGGRSIDGETAASMDGANQHNRRSDRTAGDNETSTRCTTNLSPATRWRSGTGVEHAVTADVGGNFRIWQITRGSSHAPCVQCFSSATGKFVPRVFCVIPTPLPHTLCPAALAAVDGVFSGGGKGVSAPSKRPPALLAGGFKLRLFKAQRLEEIDALPVDVLYNDTTAEFIVCFVQSVRVYDAKTGSLKKEFHDILARSAHSGEVTSCVLDERQRKLVLGTDRGEVLVFNALNLELIKDFPARQKSPHAGHSVSQLLYAGGGDPVVMSTSSDLQLAVHDESSRGLESLQTMRSVCHAHEAEFSAAAFSRVHSLIATAATDSSLHVWDFTSLKLLHILSSHNCHIGGLTFVDPLPLLVSADSGGNILLWATRPRPDAGRCLFAFKNLGTTNVPSHVSNQMIHSSKVPTGKPSFKKGGRNVNMHRQAQTFSKQQQGAMKLRQQDQQGSEKVLPSPGGIRDVHAGQESEGGDCESLTDTNAFLTEIPTSEVQPEHNNDDHDFRRSGVSAKTHEDMVAPDNMPNVFGLDPRALSLCQGSAVTALTATFELSKDTTSREHLSGEAFSRQGAIERKCELQTTGQRSATIGGITTEQCDHVAARAAAVASDTKCAKDTEKHSDSQSYRVMIFTGDEQGMLKRWDASLICHRAGLAPTPLYRQTHRQRGYNAYRHLHIVRHSSGSNPSTRAVCAEPENKRFVLNDEAKVAAEAGADIALNMAVIHSGKLKPTAPRGRDSLEHKGMWSGCDMERLNYRQFHHQKNRSRAKNTNMFATQSRSDLNCANYRRSLAPTLPLSAWLQQDGVNLASCGSAHDEGIRSIHTIARPPTVISISYDKSVRLFDWLCQCTGSLWRSDAESHAIKKNIVI